MQMFEGSLVKMTKHYFEGNTRRSANNNVIQEEWRGWRSLKDKKEAAM